MGQKIIEQFLKQIDDRFKFTDVVILYMDATTRATYTFPIGIIVIESDGGDVYAGDNSTTGGVKISSQ